MWPPHTKTHTHTHTHTLLSKPLGQYFQAGVASSNTHLLGYSSNIFLQSDEDDTETKMMLPSVNFSISAKVVFF